MFFPRILSRLRELSFGPLHIFATTLQFLHSGDRSRRRLYAFFGYAVTRRRALEEAVSSNTHDLDVYLTCYLETCLTW